MSTMDLANIDPEKSPSDFVNAAVLSPMDPDMPHTDEALECLQDAYDRLGPQPEGSRQFYRRHKLLNAIGHVKRLRAKRRGR